MTENTIWKISLIGLGNFGDNIDGLKKAIAYLERVDSTLEKGD